MHTIHCTGATVMLYFVGLVIGLIRYLQMKYLFLAVSYGASINCLRLNRAIKARLI